MSTKESTRRGEFQELAKAHASEVVRDRRTTVAILVSFLAVIGLLGGIDVLITASAGQSPGLLQGSLGLVSITGFMAVALVITTVPLVGYRHRGILRQLSTTPARHTTFLLAHVPVRAGIILAESSIVIALALICGLNVKDTMLLAVTLLHGAAMLLSLGYFVAARMTNPDIALQLSYLVPMLVLVTSGALFPLAVYPEAVRIAMSVLPTTWIVDTINAQIGGTEPSLPLGVTWCLLGLITAVFSCAAARLFRWTTPD